MNKNLHSSVLLLAMLVVVMLAACSPKQTLQDIDPQAEIEFGLAFPVGDINLVLGDFLHTGNVSNFLQVDDDSVLFYQDTFLVVRSFHSIDLRDYMSSMTTTLNIGDKLPAPALALGYIDGDGVNGFDMEFPLTMHFNGINSSVDDERLDSMVIKSAVFTSNLHINGMDLQWDEIKQLDIVLGNAFRRSGGNTIDLLSSGTNWGTDIPITIDEFTLDLMDDKTQPPSSSNVKTEADMKIKMRIVPNNGHRVNVSSSASITYYLGVEFMDYYAIYGRFAASNSMRDEGTIRFAESWDGWNDLLALNLPLAEPKIVLNIKHYLSIPLIMYGKCLWAQSEATGEKIYATFGPNANDTTVQLPLRYVAATDPYDAYTITPRIFDNQESNGRIDRLFAIRPDILGYGFDVVPNYAAIPQARLTPNNDIEIETIVTVPFVFNPGVDLAIEDTVRDINIDQFSLDSLLNDVDFVKEMKTASLKLALTTENYIPFDVDATVTFLDENDQEIDLKINENNTLHIAGPSRIMGMDAVDPTQSLNTIAMDKENMEKLAKVKAIKYRAALGHNTVPVRLKSTNNLKIKIGLMANIDASLDMNELINLGKDDEQN